MPPSKPPSPDLFERLLDKFDDQHKERMEEAVRLRASIDASNSACRELHDRHQEAAQERHERTTAGIADVKASTPGKWEFRSILGFLFLMVAFVLVLYAQSRGQNVKEAVDATKNLVPLSTVEAPP